MSCITTSRYKAVPSGALHSAAVRTNTSEGRRRTLSPANDPKGSPLAPGSPSDNRGDHVSQVGGHALSVKDGDTGRTRRLARHIPFSVGPVYAARPHRSPPRGSHSALCSAHRRRPGRARRHHPRACWGPDGSLGLGNQHVEPAPQILVSTRELSAVLIAKQLRSMPYRVTGISEWAQDFQTLPHPPLGRMICGHTLLSAALWASACLAWGRPRSSSRVGGFIE